MQRQDRSPAAWFGTASISAMVAKTATSPLERIKVLYMVQTRREYKGLVPTFRKIWWEEGIYGLFKGNALNCLRVIPAHGIRMTTFQTLKKPFIAISGLSGDDFQDKLLIKMVCGGTAGAVSVLCTYPIDLVRVRRSLPDDKLAPRMRAGLLSCLASIAKEEGILGLYRGLSPTLLGIVPFIAVNFTAYEMLREYIYSSSYIGFHQGLLVGSMAGTIALLLTFPIDIIHKRMTLQGMGGQWRYYHNITHALKSIYKQEGWIGYTKGLLPSLLKVVPATAVSWGTMEGVTALASHVSSHPTPQRSTSQSRCD